MSLASDLRRRLGSLFRREEHRVIPPLPAAREFRTVTVTGCSSGVRADGRMALILETQEVGGIAFVVTRAQAVSIGEELRQLAARTD
jgi:hypothetical protein